MLAVLMDWDIVFGVLFAAFVIGVSTLAGRSLDRARAASRKRAEKPQDSDLYGDF
jgi:hypothetical protein